MTTLAVKNHILRYFRERGLQESQAHAQRLADWVLEQRLSSFVAKMGVAAFQTINVPFAANDPIWTGLGPPRPALSGTQLQRARARSTSCVSRLTLLPPAAHARAPARAPRAALAQGRATPQSLGGQPPAYYSWPSGPGGGAALLPGGDAFAPPGQWPGPAHTPYGHGSFPQPRFTPGASPMPPQQPSPAPPPPQSAGGETMAAQMASLRSMYELGAITEDEMKAGMRKLLSGIGLL